MSLTGSATGPTRAALIKEARGAASAYYDTECVAVELSNEQCEYVHSATFSAPEQMSVASYAADWKAEVQHRWEQPAYGFPKCVKCKLENYHS